MRQHANRILTESMLTGQKELISEVMGEAQRNARGAIGLKHVLNALERQEVQTLLMLRELQGGSRGVPKLPPSGYAHGKDLRGLRA